MHWRRKWQPTPVFLPGESQGQGSLVGCSLRGHTESDTTERLHFHFSLSYIGEGNGNPLQCPCLENPMDRGVWWAAVYGVAKSWTQLSDFTFTFHFSLSCIGEGNGNPVQCSCLENPRGRRAWWADVYGVTQSQTWLKWLSSSSRLYLNLKCYKWNFMATLLPKKQLKILKSYVIKLLSTYLIQSSVQTAILILFVKKLIFCMRTYQLLKFHSEWKWKLLSHVQLFVTPWTIQSMELSRPKYWSR